MATVIPKPDDEIVHTVEDANPTSGRCVENLIIQCDNHGLTVECPMGEIITIDFSQGQLNVYRFNSRDESNPDLLTSINARSTGETS